MRRRAVPVVTAKKKRKKGSQWFGWLGCLAAPALSYATNHSVGWAILHFFGGWIYVIYWAVVHRND